MKDAKFVDVDGIQTRYYEAGTGDPLVLVHGGNMGSYYSADHWSLNFDQLSEHFHVYALDKLGQGYTDNPRSDADYTMGATIDHFFGFLRALDIGRASLLGHSRGALPVTRMAVEHPELVKTLIILDSSTLAPENPATPQDFYQKLDAGAPDIPNEEVVRREPEAASISREHITDEFVQSLLKMALLPKMIEAKKRIRGPLETAFLADVLIRKNETLEMIRAGRLKTPTLIIWGRDDISAPFKLGIDLFNLIGSVVDRVQLHVFNRAGHYLYREHPRELNRQVIEFVRGP